MSGRRPDPTVLTPAHLRAWPLPDPGAARPDGAGDRSGKDVRGRVLVVGGSGSSPGAPLLSGTAALRVGAGKVQLAVPASHALAVGLPLPEGGTLGLAEAGPGCLDAEAAAATLVEAAGSVDAMLIGPGWDDPAATSAIVEAVVPRLSDRLPLVLDAFALGALPACPAAAAALRRRSADALALLTPNAAEAARLLGRDQPLDEPAAAAAEIAERYGCVVALRGNVADPSGQCWLEGSGPAGLATSGSGDVLSGLAAGLLARGAAAAQAACWACALHGTAGDRLAARVGARGFLARELLDEAPRVLAELRA